MVGAQWSGRVPGGRILRGKKRLLTGEFGETPVNVHVGVGGVGNAGFDQRWT